MNKSIEIVNRSGSNKHSNLEIIQLKTHENLINQLIRNNSLVHRLKETREMGFKRNKFPNQYGLHAMRNGTVLDGKENYFTTDIIFDKKNYPGNSRALWSCKMSSTKVKSFKFIGIVNTHQDKYSENNLIQLNRIQSIHLDKYIQVKVTDRFTLVKNIICVFKYTREMN